MRNPGSSSAGEGSSTTSKTPCCSKVGLKRGPWTPEEDELLANYVRREGEGRWRTMPKRAGLLRCGKSCRLRWMNYLRPCVKHGRIAPDEEDLILRLHRLLGNRWSLIAGRIPGRTDNEIKNYWNTHLSKKLISQGIDPRTHKPLISTPNNPYNPNHNSSVSKQNPNYNPSPNPNSSGLSGKGSMAQEGVIIDKGKEQIHETNQNQDRNWKNSNDLMMGFQSRHGIINDDDDIDFFTDSMFSSFLNSLNNEDVFGNQQLPSYPLLSSSEAFGYGALASSSDAFNLDEHKGF